MQDTLARHELALLQFSGGKDSLACLEMCKPYLDKIIVCWVNTGDAFPETIALMEKVRRDVPWFWEVNSNQPRQIETHGWPVDVLPVEYTAYGRTVTGDERPIMQGYPMCCGANLWAPLQIALKQSGATLLIRGTKASDGRKHPVRSGDVVEGVEYLFPVWEWSDAEVSSFLAEKLPPHYATLNTSLDCRHCTAYLGENQSKLAYMREHHPELACEVSRRLQIITDAVRSELAHLEGAQ